MPIVVFVTLAALTLSPPTRPAGAPSPAARASSSSEPFRPRPAADAAGAYSLHARRRLAAYLRLRLLEMREAGLERAAKVIEGRLPVEALLPPRRP